MSEGANSQNEFAQVRDESIEGSVKDANITGSEEKLIAPQDTNGQDLNAFEESKDEGQSNIDPD